MWISRSSALRIHAYEPPDVLFTPEYVGIAYIQPGIGVPPPRGPSTLPGYYGSTYSYWYRGAYDGGPNGDTHRYRGRPPP